MRRGEFSMRATLAAALIGGFTFHLSAQPPAPVIPDNARNPLAGDQQAVTKGAVLFRQECMYCHGVSARGGMRGPDLTTGAWNHGGSDVDLARTITDGVPGTDMPPHSFKIEEIWQIVSYLRTVQQPAAPPTGDRARGEALFFGTARCSTCHIVNGRGGRLGPELSTAGSARSRAYLVESIRQPSKQLTQNRSFGGDALKYDTVTAVTADGRTIVGVPMNEDTFTVQLMDMSERVHSLDKKTLKSLRHESRSLMPAYDASRLSDADLDNVVAYLQSLRSPATPAKGGSHDN
ncbi:MAG TPA: c-type cytochrome [Vicinamibacterales bacterium]|nr:c-type cytochrome [Vicinamibacterales bacterium]